MKVVKSDYNKNTFGISFFENLLQSTSTPFVAVSKNVSLKEHPTKFDQSLFTDMGNQYLLSLTFDDNKESFIGLELEANQLIILIKQKEGDFLIKENQVELPKDLKYDKIKATYLNDELVVILPKRNLKRQSLKVNFPSLIEKEDGMVQKILTNIRQLAS